MTTEILPEVSNLLEIVKSIISKAEENQRTKLNDFNVFMKDKESRLENLTEQNKKLEEEKKDFLKVSFVNKWIKENEELKIKFESIFSSHESLKKVNKKLNFVLDQMTEEELKKQELHKQELHKQELHKQEPHKQEPHKQEPHKQELHKQEQQKPAEKNKQTKTTVDASTQCDFIHIKTNKGLLYVLKEDTLFTHDTGKEIGSVVSVLE